jgi:hypothetical protein
MRKKPVTKQLEWMSDEVWAVKCRESNHHHHQRHNNTPATEPTMDVTGNTPPSSILLMSLYPLDL